MTKMIIIMAVMALLLGSAAIAGCATPTKTGISEGPMPAPAPAPASPPLAPSFGTDDAGYNGESFRPATPKEEQSTGWKQKAWKLIGRIAALSSAGGVWSASGGRSDLPWRPTSSRDAAGAESHREVREGGCISSLSNATAAPIFPMSALVRTGTLGRGHDARMDAR